MTNTLRYLETGDPIIHWRSILSHKNRTLICILMLFFRNTLVQPIYLSNTLSKSLSVPYQQHRNRSPRRRWFGRHREWNRRHCEALLPAGYSQLRRRKDEINPGRSSRWFWHSWDIWTVNLNTAPHPKRRYSNVPRTVLGTIAQETSSIKIIYRLIG